MATMPVDCLAVEMFVYTTTVGRGVQGFVVTEAVNKKIKFRSVIIVPANWNVTIN